MDPLQLVPLKLGQFFSMWRKVSRSIPSVIILNFAAPQCAKAPSLSAPNNSQSETMTCLPTYWSRSTSRSAPVSRVGCWPNEEVDSALNMMAAEKEPHDALPYTLSSGRVSRVPAKKLAL